jgi:hypothetical protein
MIANEPFAPYDQNRLSNHKLSITKPLKYVKIILRHLLTRVTIFRNVALDHGYKS